MQENIYKKDWEHILSYREESNKHKKRKRKTQKNMTQKQTIRSTEHLTSASYPIKRSTRSARRPPRVMCKGAKLSDEREERRIQEFPMLKQSRINQFFSAATANSTPKPQTFTAHNHKIKSSKLKLPQTPPSKTNLITNYTRKLNPLQTFSPDQCPIQSYDPQKSEPPDT